MPRLILLNGPPGIGKSTLARRWVDQHPRTLDCDIDVLRTFIGGWQADFGEAGSLIRPAALALITAYLRGGHDVVLPQLFARVSEIERFEAAAHDAGAEFVECLLMAEVGDVVARFHARGADDDGPWHRQVRGIVADEGGDEVLVDYHRRLTELPARRPLTRVVAGIAGDEDRTYRDLVTAIG